MSTELFVVDSEEQHFGFFGGEEFWLSSGLKSESRKEKPCELKACDPHSLFLLWSWVWKQFFLFLRGWASLVLSKAWEQYLNLIRTGKFYISIEFNSCLVTSKPIEVWQWSASLYCIWRSMMHRHIFTSVNELYRRVYKVMNSTLLFRLLHNF